MKQVVCEDCSDCIPILVMKPRSCECERHTAWCDKDRNTCMIFDRERHWLNGVPEFKDWKPACFVLGIHNDLMSMPLSTHGATYKEYIAKILSDTLDNYLFKDWNSCVIKVFPFMFGNDVKWAEKLI